MNNDLSRILAQLAASAPTAPPPQPSQQQKQSKDPRLQQQQQSFAFPGQAPFAPQNAAAAAATVVVAEAKPDPRAIKDYPAAVRYITKTLVRDTEVMERIRRMKERQREHERMWWVFILL
jgi:hypothetical protein